MLHIFALFVLVLSLETIFHTTTVFECDSSTLWTSTRVPAAPTSSTRSASTLLEPVGFNGDPLIGATSRAAILLVSTTGSSSTLLTAPGSLFVSSVDDSSKGLNSSSATKKGSDAALPSSIIVSPGLTTANTIGSTRSGNEAAQLNPLSAFNVLFW